MKNKLENKVNRPMRRWNVCDFPNLSYPIKWGNLSIGCLATNR